MALQRVVEPGSYNQPFGLPGVLVARRYRVRGRVQGVGFRFHVERAALREGLHGWVRNLPDGSVEAEAEGEATALERFETALRQGPPAARVDEVEVTDVAAHGRATGFHIRG